MTRPVVYAAGFLLQHEGGGDSLLALEPGLMVWTWIIFGLLLLVLWKFAWGPILGALESRERRIQQALDEASQEREEAARLLREHRGLLNRARGEAQEIVAESRKAAERLRAELLEEARSEKDQIVARAQEEIGRERERALEALRSEAVDLSISAASRVLEKNLDSDENRRLALEYLERLEASGGNGSS